MPCILKGKISLIINGGMSQTITFIIEYSINYSGGESIIHISFKLRGEKKHCHLTEPFSVSLETTVILSWQDRILLNKEICPEMILVSHSFLNTNAEPKTKARNSQLLWSLSGTHTAYYNCCDYYE